MNERGIEQQIPKKGKRLAKRKARVTTRASEKEKEKQEKELENVDDDGELRYVPRRREQLVVEGQEGRSLSWCFGELSAKDK
jgi:hypothetical protein